MGSSQSTLTSTPTAASTSDKSSAGNKQDVTELLTELNLTNTNSKATAELKLNSMKEWDMKLQSDSTYRLASVVIQKSDFATSLVSRKAIIKDTPIFNVKLSYENSTVANQKSSGRCWLFAATNVIRNSMSKKYDLEEFELSQSYLYFYDTFEKANYFLENMLDLATEPLDGREVQYILSQARNDGGQFDLAVNLIEKYGLVPQSIFPESFSSSATGKLNTLLTSKLKEYALESRSLHSKSMKSLNELNQSGEIIKKKSWGEMNAIAKKSARGRKEEQIEEVYRILCTTLGNIPKPDEPFTWEYTTLTTKKFTSITHTPLSFYREFSAVDVSKSISLINDPRNPFNTLYTVQRLGNVLEGRPVLYVNTEIDNLKNVAIKLLQSDIPVWFGCDVGKNSDSGLGLMDLDLMDLEVAFGTTPHLTKEEGLRTGNLSLTHAMTLTGVHLDSNGKPVRWRVENSWGVLACNKGYMLMTDEWFTENVLQIVADRRKIPAHLVKIFENDIPVGLKPWDVMGSLA